MQEAREIAGKLTKAQREALLSAYDIGFGFITTFASGRSAKALHRRGLTHLAWAPSGLSALGLAVRATLTKDQPDGR
jgi:hypothetical protein